jgi:hypothetical protein
MEELVAIRITALDAHMLDASGKRGLGGVHCGQRCEQEWGEECEDVIHGFSQLKVPALLPKESVSEGAARNV